MSNEAKVGAFTLAGMWSEVMREQPENALFPILVTLPSLGITLVEHPAISVFGTVFLDVSIKQFPALW